MPIDWGSREAIFRLLSAAFAVLGKERFRGTYGEIAKLFGEPATYDAIQCQFREVSKMADVLRAGQAGTENIFKLPRAPKPVRRPARQSPNLNPGNLEVIARSREVTAPDGVPGLQHQEAADEGAETLRAAPRRSRARMSPPPPSSTSSSEARTIPHHEEGAHERPVPPPRSMPEPTKLIPQVIIIPDQVDRSQYRVVPPSSTDEVTVSFEAEMAAHSATLAQPSEVKEGVTRNSLTHAEERAQFRKLYSSDSHSTQAEHVDAVLSQSSQEHAAERARYRSLYYPDEGKDTAAVWENISGAHSTASAQDRQRTEDEEILGSPLERNKVPGIARFFGKNAKEEATADNVSLPDHLARFRENNVSPPSDATRNRDFDGPIRPATSYMDPDTRKCLLCDGRRFPGKAFYKHEHGSRRHRDNLRDNEKVSKGIARLERKQRRGIYQCKKEENLLPAERKFRLSEVIHPPSQDREQRPQNRDAAMSPDQSDHSPSLPPQRKESLIPRHELLNRAKVERPMQDAEKGEYPSLIEEAHERLRRFELERERFGTKVERERLIQAEADRGHMIRGEVENLMGVAEVKTLPPPPWIKRKYAGLEPEQGESSTQGKAKKAKHGEEDVKACDNVLVQMSSADLGKLLELHPDIFDTNWKDRNTPAPPGWQATGPSNRSVPRDRSENAAHRRQGHDLEEMRRKETRAALRGSSETSHEYFRCSSRCDDSQDSDYQDEEELEEDEEELEEDEEMDEEEQEDEDEDEDEDEENF